MSQEDRHQNQQTARFGLMDLLDDLIEQGKLRVTFDDERNVLHPCYCCRDDSAPRTLEVVGHYLNKHKDDMTRPLCKACQAGIENINHGEAGDVAKSKMDMD